VVLGFGDVDGDPALRPDLLGNRDPIPTHSRKEHALFAVEPELGADINPHGADLLKVSHGRTRGIVDWGNGLEEVLMAANDNLTHGDTVTRVDHGRSHGRVTCLTDHRHEAELELHILLIAHGDANPLGFGIRLPRHILLDIPVGQDPMHKLVLSNGSTIGFLAHPQGRLKLRRQPHQTIVIRLGDGLALVHRLRPTTLDKVLVVVLIEAVLSQTLKGVGDVDPVLIDIPVIVILGLVQDEATGKGCCSCTITNPHHEELARLPIEEVGVVSRHKQLSHLSCRGIQILLVSTEKVSKQGKVVATKLHAPVLEARAGLVLLDDEGRLSSFHQLLQSQRRSVGTDRLLALESILRTKDQFGIGHNQLVVGHVNAILVLGNSRNLVDCSTGLDLVLLAPLGQPARNISTLMSQGIHQRIVATTVWRRILLLEDAIRILDKVLLNCLHGRSNLVHSSIIHLPLPVIAVLLNELVDLHVNAVGSILKVVENFALVLRQHCIRLPSRHFAEDVVLGLGLSDEDDVLASGLVMHLTDLQRALVDEELHDLLPVGGVVGHLRGKVDRHVDADGVLDAGENRSNERRKRREVHVEPIQSRDYALYLTMQP